MYAIHTVIIWLGLLVDRCFRSIWCVFRYGTCSSFAFNDFFFFPFRFHFTDPIIKSYLISSIVSTSCFKYNSSNCLYLLDIYSTNQLRWILDSSMIFVLNCCKLKKVLKSSKFVNKLNAGNFLIELNLDCAVPFIFMNYHFSSVHMREMRKLACVCVCVCMW